WLVLLISGGAWVVLREHGFNLTQETGFGMMVGNLTVSPGMSRIGSAVILIRISCCQIPWNLVQRRVYAHSDYLLGELAGWSPWN
ncbi:hypothetical protein B9Z19DRAFT_892260, partial [Tuber borchii]